MDNATDISLTQSQKLLYRAIAEGGALQSNADGADALFEREIPRILRANILYGQIDPLGRRSRYEMVLTNIIPPEDVKSYYEMHERKLTLSTTVKTSVRRTWIDEAGNPIRNKQGEIISQQASDFVFIKAPSTHGGKYGLKRSKREMFESGDCPLTPPGVVMIKGNWNHIILQNKVKYDMALTYPTSSGEVITTVTCTAASLSTVKINVKEESLRLMVHTSSLGTVKSDKSEEPLTYYIPAFNYLAVLMDKTEMVDGKEVHVSTDDETMAKRILKYVPSKYKDICAELLLYSYGHDNKQQVISTVRSTTSLDNKVKIDVMMLNDIYPVLPLSLVEDKIEQLCYVLSRHLLYMTGAMEYRPHDRDSAALFRMDTFEILVSKLIADKTRIALEHFIDNPLEDLNKSADVQRAIQQGLSVEKLYSDITSVSSRIQDRLQMLTEDLESAFSKGSFGGKHVKRSHYSYGKGEKGEQGVVAKLKTDSLSEAYSRITQISVPANPKGKNYKVRSVHASNVGYIDLFHTPDDQAAGLVRHLGTTTYISTWTDPGKVVDFIHKNNLVTKDPQSDDDVVVLVVGIIQGWANGEKLVSALNAARLKGGELTDYQHSMFFHDKRREEVVILTDAGRLTRPMLVVRDYEHLAIDEKDLWEADIKTALEEGVIRYVDAYEAEYGSLIGQYPAYFHHRWDEINKARAVLQQLLAVQASSRPGTVVRGVDISKLLRTLIGYRVASSRGVVPVVDESAVTYEELGVQIDALRAHINKAISRVRYNYCEIDADAISGFAAAIVPFLYNNSGTKISYASHINTQAIGVGNSNYSLKRQATLRILNNGQRPMVETGMARIMGISELPASQNVMIAIISGTGNGDYGGSTQEDAVQIKKQAADRGLGSYSMYKQVSFEETASMNVRVSRPSGNEYEEKYANLDNRGIVSLGSLVDEGDVIMSLEYKNDLDNWTRRDIVAKPGERGVVDDVFYTASPLYIQVCLKEVRRPEVGKLSTMHGNKGIISDITDESEMPYDPATGLVPDVIISPIGLLSRGTIGLFIEGIVGAASAILGQRANAAGMGQSFDRQAYEHILARAGLDPKGERVLIDRRSGERYRCTIATGIAQVQLLNKTVEEDTNFKGRVDRHPWNMAPVKGKKRGGAIRMGEGERDGITQHGAQSVLEAIYSRASDGITVPVCHRCGRIAAMSLAYNQFTCTYCENKIMATGIGAPEDARDIVRVDLSGSWRHISYVLMMRGIEVPLVTRKRAE